jgi:glucose-1-phosphate cytidylyltransferase
MVEAHKGGEMQVAILCGGSGTRLREQTEFIPKPLVPIGGIPMVIHIMRRYAMYGFKDFVLALGYKQDAFKMFFTHRLTIMNDLKIELDTAILSAPEVDCNWNIVLSDTGETTMKGARLKKIEKHIEDDTFCMTYGDGIGDIDIAELVAFHKSHGRIATVTGVHPAPRFGEIHRKGNLAVAFNEKPQTECLVNGGFFVFNREIFDYLTEDPWCDLEVGPLELIASEGELMVYHHKGYWGAMDNIADMGTLNELWNTGKAKWR